MDEIMCNDEIGQLLGEISLPRDVSVTVIRPQHPHFKVPVVSIDTNSGENLTQILQSAHSQKFWPNPDTEISLTVPQKSVLNFLEKKLYFT